MATHQLTRDEAREEERGRWRGHEIAATLRSYGQGGSSQHSFGDRGDGGDNNRQRCA